MKQYSSFKNPEEATSEDDLDELGDDMEVVIENGNDSDIEFSDAEEDNANEDGQDGTDSNDSDSEYRCDDESFSSGLRTSDTDDDISVDKTLAKTTTAAISAAGTSKDNTSTAPAADATTQSEKSNDDTPKSSGALELCEDDEEDETVRAMIAAIKKPRSSPQEIKLDDFITDICFHPENDIIALATITGDVYLYTYSTEDNMLLRTIEVHAKACRDVEFSDDGRNLLTCSKDKSIMITDMVTEKLKKFYESAHDDAINKLYVLDEHLFASGDDAGTVKLWDLRTKDAIFALKEVEDYVTQIISNESKKLLLVTSGDGYLSTFNIGARKLYVQSEPYEEELNCMGIYRGDSKLVVGTSKGNLYTYNWGQFGYHCDMYPGIKTPISQMIPLTDRIGCVAGEEGIIRACHIAPYRNLGIVGQHSMPIECMDINTSGELIASSSHNNDVRFWNIKYFEEFNDIKYNEKHNPHREKRHNLPSSKFANNSDFFADLANDE